MSSAPSSMPSVPHPFGPEWDEAARYGIDVSLLEYTLRLTTEQRIQANDSALDLIKALRDGIRVTDEQSASTS